MEQFLFYKRDSVSVLLIGHMAKDEILVESAKKICKNLFMSTSPEDILTIVSTHKIDLVFGTPSYEGISCMPVLQAIKKKDETTDIIIFLQKFDSSEIKDEALILKCSRYFSMEHEREHALKHLRDGIHDIVRKNIYLKGTQYFDVLLRESVVSQSDAEGNITFINENFTKITGYTKEEVLGKNHRILKHPENSEFVFKEMWETISAGNVWRERLLNRNKDGSDFWADTIIIPFRDERTGKIVQYIAIRRDITQMLLEKRAIHAKSLKAQEEMRLSEAKDAFLILFTHELKTPLNAIINFSEYLHKNMYRIEEIPKEKSLQLLHKIHKNATSMLESVVNILDLSKLKHHKINFNFAVFNLKESIQDVIESHEALATENRRTIFFQDDGSEPYLTSDEYRFKQIVANIISNAIKYGSSAVEVFLLSDKEKIDIIIEDDGKGVEDKKGAFELYEQGLQGLTTMEKKGTGIGLHFVKLLCEELHFEYSLEDSTALGGAKFILTKRFKEKKNV